MGRRAGPTAPPIDGRSFEHDDRVGGGFPMKKRKGRGPFRGKMYSGEQGHRGRNRGAGGAPPRPRLEDRDGDVAMNDTLDNPRNRYNPYGHRPSRHEDWSARDQGGPSNIHITVRRDMPPQDQRGGSRENRKQWFRITIPQGRKYEKTWILSAIQSACTVPFIPIEFHFDRMRAEFYVEGENVAKALQQLSRRITDKDDNKMVILIKSCNPPPSTQKEFQDLKDEDIVQLKLCMSRRYDGALQALDLKNVRSDTELMTQGVVVMLQKRSCMEAVLRIIEENIPELLALDLSNNKLCRLEDLTELPQKAPLLKHLNLSGNELKTERELDRLKGMKLQELWLDGNPLCDFFRDQSSYISAIRERFPKLLRLDGHDLPPPIAFDVETPTTLPPSKGSYFGSDDIKLLVLRFLHQYYSVYDSGNRQALLDAYHDGACCSINIPFFTQNQNRNNLSDYFKDSRNVKKQKDPIMRFKLLKHTRLSVVAFLNELPKTLHDINSFVIDITAQTNTLLCFAVHGVFKEVEGKFRDSTRAFNRVFIAVPAANAGLCIVNDQLHVRQATTEEIRKAFVTPAPTPSSSPVLTLPSTHQEMLQAFSLQSGMNLEWSQKCLIDNDWDFARSAQIFTQLKLEGKIPDVAFLK
ncbi:nuclear RNA export factor 1 [Ambystoma mexicanum]|uniref:nuclear RNA export factor 1 n=1 Tax=Ambystoma mexicanum TaxID=8296 RepID=UPI0037E7DE0F